MPVPSENQAFYLINNIMKYLFYIVTTMLVVLSALALYLGLTDSNLDKLTLLAIILVLWTKWLIATIGVFNDFWTKNTSSIAYGIFVIIMFTSLFTLAVLWA